MAWYGVRALFRSIHETRPGVSSLWEMRIYVVEAEDHERAIQVAEAAVRSDEVTLRAFDGAKGDPPGKVRWVCEKFDVEQFGKEAMRSGVEIYSRLLKSDEVAAWRNESDGDKGD